jgi:hypothetical protein
MGLGIPKFVKSVISDGKKAVHAVAPVVEHPVRGAEQLGKSLANDAFEAANKAFRHYTSTKDKELNREELGFAGVANDKKEPETVRTKARNVMRKMMGAEPLKQLDPLPATASAGAERERSAIATTWNPSKERAGSALQWTTSDSTGQHRSDPVNLYVHGKLSDIVRAFQKGGWTIAEQGHMGVKDYTHAVIDYEKRSAEGVLPLISGVGQAIYHAVNKMPTSDLYLNGQRELVSMEANNHPLTGRDHFRIFATGKKDSEGNNIYAIAASRDEGQKLDLHRKKTMYTNHYVQTDADPERDYVLKTLQASGEKIGVKTLSRTTEGAPRNGLHSGDGKVYDVTLG